MARNATPRTRTTAPAAPSLADDIATLDAANVIRTAAEREALSSGLVTLTDGVPTLTPHTDAAIAYIAGNVPVTPLTDPYSPDAIAAMVATGTTDAITAYYAAAPAPRCATIRAAVTDALSSYVDAGDIANAMRVNRATLTRSASVAAKAPRTVADYADTMAARAYALRWVAATATVVPADVPADVRADVLRASITAYMTLVESGAAPTDTDAVKAATAALARPAFRTRTRSGEAANPVTPRIVESLLHALPVGVWHGYSAIGANRSLSDDVRLSPTTYGAVSGAAFGGRIAARVDAMLKAAGHPSDGRVSIDGIECRVSVAGVHPAGIRVTDRDALAAWASDNVGLDVDRIDYTAPTSAA